LHLTPFLQISIPRDSTRATRIAKGAPLAQRLASRYTLLMRHVIDLVPMPGNPAEPAGVVVWDDRARTETGDEPAASRLRRMIAAAQRARLVPFPDDVIQMAATAAAIRPARSGAVAGDECNFAPDTVYLRVGGMSVPDYPAASCAHSTRPTAEGTRRHGLLR